MSKIAFHNNLGRPYNINYVVKGDNVNGVRNVFLKPGLNIVDSEEFEMVKDNPLVKGLLEQGVFKIERATEGTSKPVKPEPPKETHKDQEKK